MVLRAGMEPFSNTSQAFFRGNLRLHRIIDLLPGCTSGRSDLCRDKYAHPLGVLLQHRESVFVCAIVTNVDGQNVWRVIQG